jgi:head-tail adaptor
MALSALQIAQMQHAGGELMTDTCVVQTRTATADTYGEMIGTYSDGDALACGFRYLSGGELATEQMRMLRTEAELRLPIGTTVTALDRVKLTKRYGAALTTTLVFEVVGPIRRGPAGLLLMLRKVEP